MFEALGQYKILDRIGAGGIGDIYRGRDTRLGRTVAIKVVKPEIAGDPARRERFVQDARAAMALSHPTLAAVYEIGEDQGELFVAIEFVPGEPLHAAIGGRPMNPKRAIDFAVQIADALADAHAAGIVHGDLKPANIIVTPKGRVKILECGLAAWTSGGAERARAAQGTADGGPTARGTIAYLSPEQALGERGDERTDIFSLGVMLFEMLTGRLPFDVAEAPILHIVQAAAPAPSSLNAGVPRELDPIVQKALAKSLDQRCDSAATLAAELRGVAAILDERAAAAELHAPPAARRPKTRVPWVGIVVLVIVAAALVATWLFLRH
jgi:serine/threonine protein kinase